MEATSIIEAAPRRTNRGRARAWLAAAGLFAAVFGYAALGAPVGAAGFCLFLLVVSAALAGGAAAAPLAARQTPLAAFGALLTFLVVSPFVFVLEIVGIYAGLS